MKRKLAMLVAAAVVTSALAAGAVAVAASSPSVTTGAPTHVTGTSAVLQGAVNPNGRASTYYFQWGLTTAYGINSLQRSAGSGTKAVSVSTTATGLIPGTTYHYRLVATNGSGLSAGADRTFKTAGNPPPYVATGPAARVGRNMVTLSAVINPNKQATTWYFQYGTSDAFGSETVVATVAAGSAPVTVTATVQGLEARTIFDYRVVAQHSGAASQAGLTEAFMTLPRQRPVPRIRARTRPRTAHRRPYTFTTSGSVGGPGWIPGQFDCVGNVKVKFRLGGRRIASTLLPLQPSCRFSGQTVFAHLPGRGKLRPPVTLAVVVQFAGNGYLTPRKAPAETIALG